MGDARETRQRLIEAAISIIRDEGEDGIRVDRVAEIAGFTKPVVYHHFTDREGLVVAALTEMYYQSVSFGVTELKFSAARCKTAQQYREVLQRAIDGFSEADGIHRRQRRIEALGAAVSRPVLQASLIEANRRQIEGFGEVLQIGREEGWLRLDVAPRDLSAWWTGVMLSRHLIEIDTDTYSPEVWNSIAKWFIEQLIGDVEETR